MTLEEEWTRPQQLLAAVVYDAWHPKPSSERFRWPTFYYVAHEMRVRHSIDACDVLESFPVLGDVGIGQAHYSTVCFDRLSPTNPDAPVGLTVAGLARAAGPDQDPASIFLALLEHAGNQRRVAVVDPHEPQPVTITDQTFSRVCCTVSPGVSTAMYELIRHEPSAVTGLTPRHLNPADGSWTAEVDLPALDYTRGTTLEDYLSRVAQLFPTASGPAASPSLDCSRTFQVHARGAQGMQVGTGNTQINNNYYAGDPRTNHWLAHDQSLWQKLQQTLSYEPTIAWLQRNNFAGFAFDRHQLEPFHEFTHEWGDAAHEFLIEELEVGKSELLAACQEFLGIIAINTWPTGTDLQTVPPEWEITQPRRFDETVELIHAAAERVVNCHQSLARTAIRRLPEPPQ